MSTYQYYEFLAIDRPLDERQQAKVRALSTRARIIATSFTNEYHWGDFRGDPRTMMERYYDAHLDLANWGHHQVMLRLPRTLLDVKTVEPYCPEPDATTWPTRERLILNLTSQDESGDWVEGAEDPLSAIASVRAELAAGDLRPLYLARLAGYGTWERDECAFNDDAEEELEPPLPAGLGSLTGTRRCRSRRPGSDGAPLALTRFPAIGDDRRPRRTVAQLLDAAADIKLECERQAEAARAAEETHRAGQRSRAREGSPR